MTGVQREARGVVEPVGGVIASLADVVRDFNRTAEAVLHGLREQPPMGNGGAVRLHGEEQLRELRAALPRRVLTVTEGMQIAERQAALLRWQLGADGAPALSTETLTSLPFLVKVSYRGGLGSSGLATKTDRGWVIVLREDEPQVRQRFSLGHEIKHTLDDEPLSRFPDGLYRTWGGQRGEETAERVCDHFSACLLMPKVLVRRDWTSGLQDPLRLARRYQVSKAAMEVRLRTLGLIEPTGRCAATGRPAA